MRTAVLAVVLAVCVGYACGSPSFSTLTDALYTTIPGAPCVRLLTSAGPVGCGFPDESMGGALVPLLSQADFDVIASGALPPDDYVFVMSAEMFSLDTLRALDGSKLIGGVLLLDDGGAPPHAGFSPDSTCPLAHVTAKLTGRPLVCVPWNPLGNGMNFMSFAFPMFALNADESELALKLALENRANGVTNYPRHAAQLNSYMQGTKDTETCLRRGRCDPVGGASVWATMMDVKAPGPGQSKPNPAPRMVLLTTAMDSAGLFHDRVRGANNDISGLVALLGAAHVLGNATTLGASFVYAAFTGEAWGYYGSQMWANDVAKAPYVCDTPDGTACDRPFQFDLAFAGLNLDGLDAVIDVRQVGYTSPEETGSPAVYVHVDTGLPSGEASRELRDKLEASARQPGAPLDVLQGTSPDAVGTDTTLPPSSIYGLAPHLGSTPAVLITQHRSAFVNHYYNSIYDEGSAAIDTQYVCDTATTVARAGWVAAALDGIPPPDWLVADCELVAQLVHCLTEDFECDLVESVIPSGGQKEPSYYASIFRFSFVTPLEKFVHDLLGALTATAKPGTGGSDLVPGSHYHPAFSPGLAFDYGEFEWTVVDGSVANFVESTWMFTDVMFYRADSPVIEGVILALGIVVTTVAFGIAIAVRKMQQQP